MKSMGLPCKCKKQQQKSYIIEKQTVKGTIIWYLISKKKWTDHFLYSQKFTLRYTYPRKMYK